jgi:hypothetical protein
MTVQAAHTLSEHENSDELTISNGTLHKRIQDEVMALVILAAEVQIALGPTISNATSLSPSVQRSLQSIDRLHQTLDDLQRIMGHLSKVAPKEKVVIVPLTKTIKLRHLVHKLCDNIDSPFALAEEDSGDISWF